MIEWASTERSVRRRAPGSSASPSDLPENGRKERREEKLSLIGAAEAADRQVTLPFQEVVDRYGERSAYDRVVWAFNAVVALVGLVLLSPVMLLIAVAIKLDSPGPVIYRQLRVGLDRRGPRRDAKGGRRTGDLGGRPFVLYKFRTMRVGAEDETGPVWCSEDDDRVTRVGRFLRQHRLDELPQLWNVVKGDMSVVGPRPERPSLVSHLREEIDAYPLRQRVLPGITGWAQVNRDADRTLDDVRSKLHYDLEYLQDRSLLFDLRIMARTVPVMLERDSLRRSERPGRRVRRERDDMTSSASSAART